MSSVDGPSQDVGPDETGRVTNAKTGDAKRACPSSSRGHSKVSDEPTGVSEHTSPRAGRTRGIVLHGLREGVIQKFAQAWRGSAACCCRCWLGVSAMGAGPAGSFQMPCSSSRSFRSRDHLSPLSSAAPLCRDSLSDLREDRDTWLM